MRWKIYIQHTGKVKTTTTTATTTTTTNKCNMKMGKKLASIKLLTTNPPVHHDCNFSILWCSFTKQWLKHGKNNFWPCIFIRMCRCRCRCVCVCGYLCMHCYLVENARGTTQKYVVGIETSEKRLLTAWLTDLHTQ